MSCARINVCMLMISATEHVAIHSQYSILTGCRSSLHIPHGRTFLELGRGRPVALFTNLSLHETTAIHQKFMHQKSFNPLVTSKNFFPMCTNFGRNGPTSACKLITTCKRQKEEYAKNLVKLFNSSTQFAGAQRRGKDKWRSCQRHDAQVLHWMDEETN